MPTPRAEILRVGLTGNIGAGKSTVGAMLREAGCAVIDADRLGHRILERDPEVVELLAAEFGRRVLSPDGRVDRAGLGALVFADAAARAKLEAILHPRIREQEARWIQGAEPDSGIAVTEAALLVETGSAHRYHRLVVVTAPVRERLSRLRARGMSEPDARDRMAAQMDSSAQAAAADYVVDNGGELPDTARLVEALMEKLRGDLECLRAGISLPDR